jgi:hypothetical protein
MKKVLIVALALATVTSSAFAKDCTLNIHPALNVFHRKMLREKFDLVKTGGNYSIVDNVHYDVNRASGTLYGIDVRLTVQEANGAVYSNTRGYASYDFSIAVQGRAVRRALRGIPSCK